MDYARRIAEVENTHAESQARLQSFKKKAVAEGDSEAIKAAAKIERQLAANTKRIDALKAVDTYSHEKLRPEHDALKAKWAEEARPYAEYVAAFRSKLKTVVESLKSVKTPVELRFKFMDKRIKVGENGMYIKSVADKEGSIIYFETYREPVTMNQLGEREASIAIGDVIWENGFKYGFREFEGSSLFYSKSHDCHDICTIPADARSLRLLKNIYAASDIPDRNQAVAALEALIELQTKRVPRPDFLNGRFSTRKFPDYDDKNSLSAFVKEYSVIAQKIVIMIPPLESALSNVIKWNLPEMTFAKIAGDDLSYINSRVTPYKKAENKVHSTFGKFLDRMFPVANIIDQVEKALDTRLDISTKKAAFLHGGAQGSPRNLEHERKQG